MGDARVLAVNCGSSSVKLALLDPDSGERAASTVEPAGRGATTHADVITGVLDRWGARGRLRALLGVGHRVVHGGSRFTESRLVDDDVLDALRELTSLAPLHLPANVAGIEAVQRALPGVPQVVAFDTAFHATLPPKAFHYAVPTAWYDEHGARRYGFHGLSNRYVTQRAGELLGRPLDTLRMVIAHLGNGCSATAVRDGRSVDTTMGFTPLEGLVMGSRSGDVDPGLLAFLAPRLGLDLAGIVDVLNSESGLTGMSGAGNDVRAVVQAADGGSARAQLALDVFAYRLAKAVAALAVPLGRLDALVFTGGIGENSVLIRSMVMTQLTLLGVECDDIANAAHGHDSAGRISTGRGPVVLVVPTDEELVVARDTARLVRR